MQEVSREEASEAGARGESDTRKAGQARTSGPRVGSLRLPH